MPNKLLTLAYISRGALDPNEGLAQLELLNILLTSRRNNERAGITGAMVLDHGCFAQVLEGPQDAVESTFERIECDPRHRGITVLYVRPLARRNFAKWSMAHASLKEPSFALDGVSGADGLGLPALKGSGGDLADVLKSLIFTEHNAD